MRPISSTPPPTTTPLPPPSLPHTWHSPVPYLFGGLAAMLGLVAFALFILACSFWKLTAQSNLQEQQQTSDDHRNPQTKEGDECANKEQVKPYEEKILVIMAGHNQPTFLATPVSAKSSSFHNFATNNDSAKHILSEDKTQKEVTDNNNNNNNVEHQHQQQQTETQQGEAKIIWRRRDFEDMLAHWETVVDIFSVDHDKTILGRVGYKNPFSLWKVRGLSKS
ncbi:hypothetical protein PIB30_016288 [Stylosanthes scabra]|uniref:Uncharacterized protein n=1 Tax=Stylosanthes scabra TaxID=79078 RepID=A0ABU6Q745_9FABA|nr:hypothetical protein [Stylosanthes scabra]